VDADADLDKAVDGVLASAFGYQGQKCSACSRAIVDAQVYDGFLDKLAAKARDIKVGPAEDFGNYMGPVIGETARRTILEYIDTGKREGRLVAGGEAPSVGYFIRPTIIADVEPAPESFRKRSLAVLAGDQALDSSTRGRATVLGVRSAGRGSRTTAW